MTRGLKASVYKVLYISLSSGNRWVDSYHNGKRRDRDVVKLKKPPITGGKKLSETSCNEKITVVNIGRLKIHDYIFGKIIEVEILHLIRPFICSHDVAFTEGHTLACKISLSQGKHTGKRSWLEAS